MFSYLSASYIPEWFTDVCQRTVSGNRSARQSGNYLFVKTAYILCSGNADPVLFLGLTGLLAAGPTADALAFILAGGFSYKVLKDMEKKENLEPVDESYLKEQKEKVIEEYKALFAENDRMINRAVMSAVLSELPIFFNNISELQDYIYNTLSICMDKVEKLACIELINGIMAE